MNLNEQFFDPDNLEHTGKQVPKCPTCEVFMPPMNRPIGEHWICTGYKCPVCFFEIHIENA